MSDRTQRFIAEVGRFLAVGGAATIVALIIFNLLVHGFNTGDHALLGKQPILAYVIANSVGMGVSYYGCGTGRSATGRRSRPTAGSRRSWRSTS